MKHIVDFHAHAFPENIEKKAVNFLREYYKLDIHNEATIDKLKESALSANVDKLVVFSTATNSKQVENINSWMGANIDNTIIGFGTLHPDYKNFKKEINRISDLGLKGIKFHPDFQHFNIDDKKMWPIYEEIDSKLPILFHVGDLSSDHSSPKRLAWVLDNFPNLKIIAAHLGGYCRWEESKKYLLGKNVFLDTSSSLFMLSPKEAVDIIRQHDINKIVFGTDYPIASHQEEIRRVLALPLTSQEKEKILWENACTLLGLKF